MYNISISKLREVIREDGVIRFCMTGIRFLFGLVWYCCLKIFSKKKTALINVKGSKMHISLTDIGIGKELIIRGIHEKNSTIELNSYIQRGMHTIDVGSNIGYYALIQGKRVGVAGKVYAFEPVPANYELLEANIAQNSLNSVIIPQCLAIGDKNCTTKMNISKASNHHSIEIPVCSGAIGVIDVNMVRLDDWTRQQKIDLRDICFFRMDVEGYEARILPHMTELMRGCRFMKLFIEFHQEKIAQMTGCSFADCLVLLREMNARFDLIIAGGDNGKELLRNLDIDTVLNSNHIMQLPLMESWLSITRHRS